LTQTPLSALTNPTSLALEFFRQSGGKWKSQRRYYTLKQDVEPEEVVSFLKIRYLPPTDAALRDLAALHSLEVPLAGGSEVVWESSYVGKSRQPSTGKTIFGVAGNILYRDRGFATDKPVTAILFFPNPQTMCLKTEYGGSVFEEEIKMIGQHYRTRQSLICRAQQEIMIGQYLEKRL
jgi:hypothetical protein